MKTILWLDDNEKLIDASVEVFREHGFEIAKATNTSRALTILREQRLDGVLLDVWLRGGESGLEFLKEIRHRYPMLQVVIFTAHPDNHDQFIAKQLGASFYFTKVRKPIPVDPAKLREFFTALHEIFKTGSGGAAPDRNLMAREGVVKITPPPGSPAALVSGKRPDNQRGEDLVTQPFDVAIVCALHTPELEMVLKTGNQPWERLRRKHDDPHTYRHTVYTTPEGNPLRVIAAAPNQMGLAASAVLATKMILRFRPKLVAMVGIAAGVKTESQGFGDILAAEHTFDYGAGKVATEEGKLIFKPDHKPLDIDATLNARLKDWQANRTELNDIYDSWIGQKPRTVLTLHVGPLGSGAAVIDNRGPVKDVMEHWRKLIGVEMEAYAVHRACKDAATPAPTYLCLKSICDFAEKKEDAWQPYAAFTAAQLCYRFLVAEWENLFG